MRFDILGPLEVVGDDGAIELPPGRARTLLLLMLTRPNEALTIDALVDELWNGNAPPSAGKIVQGYVGQLRRALGTERITTRGHAYLIRLDAGELDVQLVEALRAESRTQRDDRRAETLRQAQAQFRGRALDDAGDEPFATAERHRSTISGSRSSPSASMPSSRSVGTRISSPSSSEPPPTTRWTSGYAAS